MHTLRTIRTAGAALLLAASFLAESQASSVVVPDDLPTIQQGIDSGADTVYVADGTYAEDLVAGAPLVLLPKTPQGGLYECLPLPIVGSLTTSAHLTVRSFRFTGLVTLHSPTASGFSVHFEACRFDLGMTTTGRTFSTFLHVLGCTFMGNADVIPYTGGFVNCAFIGAHLNIVVEGSAIAKSNVFENSGEYAVRAAGEWYSASITNNSISNTGDGIVIESLSGTVSNNDVSRCSGAGILAQGSGSASMWNNRIHDCDGHGIALTSESATSDLLGNVIEDVGGDGIRNTGASAYYIRSNEVRRAAGRGIFSVGVHSGGVVNNLVLNSGSDGISIGSTARADSNVVGRAGGRGIHIQDWESHWLGALRRNTIYQCAGAGIEMGGDPDSVLNNIAYANGGVGFAWTGAGTPVLACNDWFANSGGATAGVAPGVSDLAVDPMFCDLAQDDVHLSATSPLLDAAGCGQIGALGEGCTVPVSVAPDVHRGDLWFAIRPRPARAGITFTWAVGEEPARLEVFDVTGARRWATNAPPGASQLEWGLKDAAGRRLPPGVYLARVTQGGRSVSDKLVVAP